MAELGTAWLTVLPETKGFGKAMDKALGGAGGGAADRAGKSIGSRMSNAIGTSLKVGLGAVTAVAGAALVKGFQRLTAIDEARAKLTGLGHDAQSVQTIMDSALKAVKGTAFGLDEAASLAGTLVASGIKPGQDLENVLALVADSATIAGRDLGDMGLIWSSVAAKGKLQGDDAMQLLSSGIPIWQMVGDVMGVTAAEAQELGSKGQVSFEIFAQAMEEGLGGAAQASGQTFTGAMKNVGAALGRAGASFLDSAFQQMPAIFGGVTSALDSLEGGAKGAGDMVGGWLAGAVRGFTGEAQLIKDMGNPFYDIGAGLAGLGDKIGAVFRGFTGTTLVKDLNDPFHEFGGTVRDIADRVVEFGEKLSDLAKAMAPVAGELAKIAGQASVVSMFGLLNATITVLSPLIQRLTTWMENNQGTARNLGGAILIAVGAFKAFTLAMKGLAIARKVGAALMFLASTQGRMMMLFRLGRVAIVAQTVAMKAAAIATKVWAGVQKVLNAVMRMNPIGLIITGIMLLVGAFVLAYNKSETFRNIVDGALRAVGDAFKWLWDKAKQFWDWLKGVFGGGETNAAVDSFKSPFTGLGEWFGGIWESVKNAFSGAWDAVVGALSGAWQRVKDTFNAVVDWVGTFFSENWQNILLVVLGGPFALLGILIGQHWETIKNVFMNAVNAITGFVSGLVTTVVQFFTDLGRRIWGAVQSLWTTVSNGFRAGVDLVVGIVVGFATRVIGGWIIIGRGVISAVQALWNGVTTLFGTLRDRLVAIAQAIWNYITTSFTNLRDTAVAIFNAIRTFLANIFSALRDRLVAVAQAIWNRITSTFTNLRNTAVAIFNAIRDRLAAVFSNLRERLVAIAGAIRDRVRDAFSALRDRVASIVSNLRDRAVNTFSNLRDRAAGIMTGLKDRAVNAARTLRDNVVGAFNNFKDRSIGAFQSARDGIGRAWDGIKEKAKAPVKFVVNTVYNDGIKKAFDKIAGAFGMDKLPRASLGFASGGILPGYTPGRDVHDFISTDGRTRLGLSGGEGILRPEVTSVLGSRGVGTLNAARSKADAARALAGIADHMHFAGGGIINWRGGRFTSLFASRLQMADRLGGGGMTVTQGGWRPATSYSGTSHAGDAIDIAGGGFRRFIAPLRSVGIPAWDRTGKGNWVPHVHAVPLPGAGVARGSAVWQAQDYLRGGDGLGGRDNGPRGGILKNLPSIGEIGQGIIDIFMGGVQAIRDLFKSALGKLKEIQGKWWGDLIAKVPGKIVDGIVDHVKEKIPGFVDGGVQRRTGPAWVSEDGRPELVVGPQMRNLRAGTRVFDADETEALFGRKPEQHVHIYNPSGRTTLQSARQAALELIA